MTEYIEVNKSDLESLSESIIEMDTNVRMAKGYLEEVDRLSQQLNISLDTTELKENLDMMINYSKDLKEKMVQLLKETEENK